jgi:hypothetical protein
MQRSESMAIEEGRDRTRETFESIDMDIVSRCQFDLLGAWKVAQHPAMIGSFDESRTRTGDP